MAKKTLYLLLVFMLVNLAVTRAQFGQALRLDGNGDYMSVVDAPALNINMAQSYAITLWARTSVSNDFWRILSKRAGTAGNQPGYEFITNSGGGQFGVNLRSIQGTNQGPPFGSTNICDGAWHHLCLTLDVSTSKVMIWVDGQVQQTVTSASIGQVSFANTLPLLFGCSGQLTQFWNGWIDEVRIWSKALNQAQIQADALTTVSGTETGLIAAWDFENVDNQTVPELTGQYPGALHGNATTLDPTNLNMGIEQVKTYHPDFPVGRANQKERLASLNIRTIGENNPLSVSAVTAMLTPGTLPADISYLRLYYTGNSERFSPDTADLVGEANAAAGFISFPLNKVLSEGDNFFWLTADIAPTAQEGHSVGGSFAQFLLSGSPVAVTDPGTTANRTILLAHNLLFSGGDYNAANYRIPALTTAADGSLVVANDARVNQAGDLPNNIDIVTRPPTDGGHTWSAPQTIADFGASGASDPALVRDRATGDLLCLFASHTGLFQSTPANKIRFQVARSTDNGLTWGAPEEHSLDIYAPGWYAAWVASGSAHQLRNGVLVAAVGVRQNSGNTISNFMIYSADGGHTWQYSPGLASAVGDEAKIVELDNGDLQMLIRSAGQRKVTWSHDQGLNWDTPVPEPELVEPAVNGDFIRYTSVKDGYNKSRLLFSIANHPTQRRNLTVFVSYDEGQSWQTKKVVCPGPAGYVALTVLPDGTIGMFYENGEYEQYQLYFARFSLDWLTDGADSWSQASPTDDPAAAATWTVFPNPARSVIHVQCTGIEGAGAHVFRLFDETGKLVLEQPFSGNTLQQNCRHLAAGKYVYTITTANKVTAQGKLVVG